MKKLELRIHSGSRPRRYCPITVEIPGRFAPQGSVALVEQETERAFAVQINPGSRSRPTRLSMIVNHVPADTVRVYRLVTIGSRNRPPQVCLSHPVIFTQKQTQIGVVIGGDQVASYVFSRRSPRPYLYPFIGPYGVSLTRGHPMADIEGESKDYPQQRSIWVAHGDVGGGNFWTEEMGHGRIQQTDLLNLQEGPIYGYFTVRNDWVEVGGVKVLEETRTMIFYGLSPAVRMVDFDIVFRATEGDVRFGDTKDGGILSVRVASSMEVRHGGRIQNANRGINESEIWGKRAPWCDFSGTVDGSLVGLAIFDHPSNFRYPTYWHVRDYGLMTANPFALSHYFDDPSRNGSYLIRKGKEFRFRYRLFAHEGDADTGGVADAYQDWIHPPKVEVHLSGS